MAYQLGSITFANAAGVWGLTALIPLIILYLIRPRPIRMEIPSLMFLLQSKENPKRQNFLRKITKDWLFFLQLLILFLLAMHLMEPLTKYEHDITAENTIIVLDISGSSQVYEGSQTRFQKAIKQARTVLSGKNTIILAKSSPKIIANGLQYVDAADLLRSIRPTASPSAIGDAMILAGETLAGKEGRVVVISDFINTEGMDPQTAKSVLESKDIIVDMISTIESTSHPNAGIVNLEVDERQVTVFIQNFNDNDIDTSLVAGSFRKDIKIDANSVETVTFQTPKENIKIQLIYGDDFELDNTAYIATPQSDKVSVLLISNNESIFVRNALTTNDDVELDVASPPIVPTGKYDVFVLHQIRPGNILPGTFENIAQHVQEGSNLIVTAQPDMDQINYRGLLPVTRGDRAGRAFINIEQVNTFTRDLDFGSIDGYWEMSNRDGAFTIASDGFNSSIISFQKKGAGKVVYYGIEEQASDFKLAPSYPIFWVKLVQFLVGQESIEHLNIRTGDTVIFDTVEAIKTPCGNVKQNALIFECAGLYTFDNKIMAANMLDPRESQINVIKEIVGQQSKRSIELKPVRETREFSFEIPIIFIVMALLLLELIYVKWRGDF